MRRVICCIVNMIKKRKLSMIGMKLKDAIKLGPVELGKSETSPKKKLLPEAGL